MAVGPQYVFALRRAGWVKKRGLGRKNKRPLGRQAMRYRVLTGGDFFEGASKMDGDCATAGCRPPRYRLRKSIVDLEGAGRVFKRLNCLPVAGPDSVAGQGKEGARRGVAQGESIAGGQIAKGLGIDAARSVDKAAKGLEMANKCARDRLGSPSRNGPSDRVGGRAQQHGSARTEGAIEGEYGVSGESGEAEPARERRKGERPAYGLAALLQDQSAP